MPCRIHNEPPLRPRHMEVAPTPVRRCRFDTAQDKAKLHRHQPYRPREPSTRPWAK
ncbi:hypothetical protein BJ508DRAFT_418227 [Ascobolus immersus RN42]|uniref:Uncharacterized protein n=1 Tax=Ascobolus immersus RN42 TaxID=1160509 RepID=A0A3N4HTV3_ASCIM|nr:hypothetical protein BJ508DRAFT_418227 [Ascobolus immersus RN42]